MATVTENDALLDMILRVFRIFDGFGYLSSEDLFWRTDGEYAPLKIFVTCNDLFHWACADVEEITSENIGLLEATVAEVKELTGDNQNADILFCCRSRGMRPQKPYYKHIDEKLRPLFDACGPERNE